MEYTTATSKCEEEGEEGLKRGGEKKLDLGNRMGCQRKDPFIGRVRNFSFLSLSTRDPTKSRTPWCSSRAISRLQLKARREEL